MIELFWLTSALVSLLTAAFLSGSEMGLYGLNRIRLRLRSDQPDYPDARLLAGMVGRMQETILAVLLGQNLAGYLTAVTFSKWLTAALGWDAQRVEFYGAAILSPIMFVIGDIVPKNWFQTEADRLMYAAARPLDLLVRVIRLTGMPWLLQRVTEVGTRLLAGVDEPGEWHGARGEVLGLLREGAAGGAMSEEQAAIIERVLNLSDVRVEQIMVPRQKTAFLPGTADREMIERLIRKHDHSHFPVVDPLTQEVIGMVDAYELLADEDADRVEPHLRPVLRLSARDTAVRALVLLQQACEDLAVVHDARGQWVGIVTLEDLVEEIFGELS